MNKEIKGKRIILREQREEDAPFFAYWFNQPQVMFQCGFEKPTDEEEVKTCINVDHKSKNSVWFTITDLDGNIIGETGLLRMFPAWHQTDLTIIIPDPKMQHKGYGTEAIRIMLDMARIFTFKSSEIYFDSFIDFTRSWIVLLKFSILRS